MDEFEERAISSTPSSMNASSVGFVTDASSIFDLETEQTLSIDMQFNDGHKLAIVMYSLLMVASAIGNMSVLNAIFRQVTIT